MQAKAFEVRDAGTFIPVLCVDMNPTDKEGLPDGDQRYLLRRCGYPCDGLPNVIMTRLDGSGGATNDPYAWGDFPQTRGARTFLVAHQHIIEHWDGLSDGDVIDVQFILGETAAPKRSERRTVPL